MGYVIPRLYGGFPKFGVLFSGVGSPYSGRLPYTHCKAAVFLITWADKVLSLLQRSFMLLPSPPLSSSE